MHILNIQKNSLFGKGLYSGLSNPPLREDSMGRVRLTDTILRDAHQSLIATRMRTRDMLPIAEDLDSVGYFSLEVWGGATFDACIRFLNENPWERLRALKKHIKDTPLQMLLRGQNLVGYRHYSDDVVIKFVEHAAKNGIDIFRVFDALNDIRNMEVSIKTAKRMDAHVQGAICFTLSPVHTIESYLKLAEELVALECDSICIKDMAGLITPHHAYELIKALKRDVDVPIHLHTHCTSGIAPMSYYAACEAGVDILDTAISPFAWGTSQPPTESIVAALKDTPYDTGLDLELLGKIANYFKEVREKYRALINPISERVDVNVLVYQIPGGMLSNLVSQLKEQGALDRFEDVLREIPIVRKELGYPPLVTPTSQIVGTQAVLNVLMGERYKVVPKEVKNYVLGYYGRTPASVDPEIKKIVIGDDVPITCRPADLLEPEYEKAKREAEELGIVSEEEDVLIYALYPQVAVDFLKGELKEEPLEPPVEPSAGAPAVFLPTEYRVEVEGDTYIVKVEPIGGAVASVEQMPKMSKPENVEGGVLASMQGTILRIKVKEGEEVREGDVVAVLEAMKMENDVVAPKGGVVKEILVKEGDTVSPGDIIMVIG
ncbi:MAG: pyruvate carboxylase subunit [Methanosarcinales archaeon]|nr:pyruvate carboxylase subunit [Methanosarcinales archaeon]MDN5295417.1 pyruvate carboxylase subunit [Methanosarcinales archaeon]